MNTQTKHFALLIMVFLVLILQMFVKADFKKKKEFRKFNNTIRGDYGNNNN